MSPYNWRDCFFVGGGWFLDLQDQYINHIMNETGATIVLHGRGSGHLGVIQDEGVLFGIASFVLSNLYCLEAFPSLPVHLFIYLFWTSLTLYVFSCS